MSLSVDPVVWDARAHNQMSRVTKKSCKEIVNWSVKLLHRKDPNLASKNMWRNLLCTASSWGKHTLGKSALAKPMATTSQHTTRTHRVSPHVELLFVLSLDTCGSAFMLNFTKRCPDACEKSPKTAGWITESEPDFGNKFVEKIHVKHGWEKLNLWN